MRVPLIRSAAGLLGLLLLALALLPMTAAWGAAKTDVQNGDEAWFLANQEPLSNLPTGDPTCELPTGCNVSGNATRKPTPHPEGVLVVAANAGEDDAQAYFNFATDKLPLGAIVTGGTVTLPVATDRESGNFRPDAADMVACLVTGFIPGGADGGSYQDRPEFDDKTCVEVVAAEDAETLTYTFNLERFGKAWSSGSPMNGLTLLKNPEIKPPAPDESWRVVFNTARRHNNAPDPKAFPPITSDLQFKVAATPGTDLPDDTVPPPPDTTGTTPPPADTGSTGTGGFDSGTTAPPPADSGTVPTDTGAAPPPATSDTPPVDDPVAAEGGEGAPAAAPAPPVVAAAAPGVSPAVWLLPLLALAMAGVLGWSLSAPVELAGQREGAVSKLMRNRRLAGDTTTA